jgi:hypothetical protein
MKLLLSLLAVAGLAGCAYYPYPGDAYAYGPNYGPGYTTAPAYAYPAAPYYAPGYAAAPYYYGGPSISLGIFGGGYHHGYRRGWRDGDHHHGYR